MRREILSPLSRRCAACIEPVEISLPKRASPPGGGFLIAEALLIIVAMSGGIALRGGSNFLDVDLKHFSIDKSIIFPYQLIKLYHSIKAILI